MSSKDNAGSPTKKRKADAGAQTSDGAAGTAQPASAASVQGAISELEKVLKLRCEFLDYAVKAQSLIVDHGIHAAFGYVIIGSKSVGRRTIDYFHQQQASYVHRDCRTLDEQTLVGGMNSAKTQLPAILVLTHLEYVDDSLLPILVGFVRECAANRFMALTVCTSEEKNLDLRSFGEMNETFNSIVLREAEEEAG